MEGASAVVGNTSQDSVIDPSFIISELHQADKIEMVVVTDDFIELGTSSYDAGEQSGISAADGGTQLISVVNVPAEDDTTTVGQMDSSCVRTSICELLLREGRTPTWPTLFDQVLEEEGGIAFSGVCSSLQRALRLKELYEDETVTQYRAKSTVATFGRTEFQRSALRRATFRLMDVRLYTPIFILAKNRYICHKGPDIDKGLKEKRKRANLNCSLAGDDDSSSFKDAKAKKRRVCGDNEFVQLEKRSRHCQLTKKVGCPASLTMYEVLIANCEDTDFDDELSWKVRIATQEIDLQRFIVVFLPRYHEGHEIGPSSASCISRSWHPDVRARLTSHLIDGIRDPDEMMVLLKNYVEMNLCADYSVKPNADDRRYYPLRTDIRNAIAYDLKEKKVPVKTDVEHLMDLFQQWSEVDPDGHVYFCPHSVGEPDEHQSLLLVYQSSVQQYLMRRYGNDLVFLDESIVHGLSVFFVSVKTNCGYMVVAWLVLAVDRVASISEGLAMVKSWSPDTEPKFVMCEPNKQHFEAVLATWPNTEVLLCDACREQHWTLWLDMQEASLQKSKLDIVAHLRRIADAGSQAKFSEARQCFVNSRLYRDNFQLQQFYTDHYLPTVKRWVQLYRKGLYTRIDAHNAHERKEGLAQKNLQSLGSTTCSFSILNVAGLLKEMVDTVWDQYYKSNVTQAATSSNLEEPVRHLTCRPHEFQSLQLKAYHKAKRFLQLCSDSRSCVEKQEGTSSVFAVKDFTLTDDNWHTVELDGNPSCSCSTFKKHKVPCQHFYTIFSAFEDVSWYNLPEWYQNHPYFTIDPTCIDNNSASNASSEMTNVRSINMHKLTGLLDRIKASADSADDSSLSSSVRLIEAAATIVEKSPPAARDSVNLESGSVFEHNSFKSSQISHADRPVKTPVTNESESLTSTSDGKSRCGLTLTYQREKQRQYLAAVVHSSEEEQAACEAISGNVWIQHGDVVLTEHHRANLLEGKLDDDVVAVSLALLRSEDQLGRYSGLISLSELSTGKFKGRHSENLVQVMKVVTENSDRWICLSTVDCKTATVSIYDCTFPSTWNEEAVYSHSMKAQIAALLTLPLYHSSIALNSQAVIQSIDGVSSGLFAIAFATDLVHYGSLRHHVNEGTLARHLESCLSSGRLLPFPKTDEKARFSPPYTSEIAICCHCRLPYSETRENDDDLMIACCSDTCPIKWYHLRCIGNVESERRRAKDGSWLCDCCATTGAKEQEIGIVTL